MRYTLSRYIGCSAAVVISLLPALAYAQQQSEAKAAAAPAKAQQAAPGEPAVEPEAVVIVTGVTRTTNKKNATF